MNNENEFDWDEFLHRVAIWSGIVMALISIYFSYDGLDQTISGGNPNYTEIAKYIGVAMAVMVTIIQFIFNTDIRNLTTTLIVGGIISYFYSIATNYLGLNHLFGFHGVLGGVIAFFWDALPEAMIAWGMRNTEQGDMIRNVLKAMSGTNRRGRGQMRQAQKDVHQERIPNQSTFQKSNYKPQHKPDFHPAQKGDTRPNRFTGFGE